MSPARVKSENELGSVTLIPVDIVVITQLSCYLAQLPSCHPKAAGHGSRSRPQQSREGSFQKALSIPRRWHKQELCLLDITCNKFTLTDFKGKNKEGLKVHAHDLCFVSLIALHNFKPHKHINYLIFNRIKCHVAQPISPMMSTWPHSTQ